MLTLGSACTCLDSPLAGKWKSHRNHFSEDFVGVEPAKFFGEAVLEASAGEGNALGWLSGLGQFGHGQAGTEELDVATGTRQTDTADAGTWRVCHDGHRRLQRQAQPAASRRVLGESEAPSTATAETGSLSTWSKTAASCMRQLVRRVQARSVSPAL